MSLLEIKCRQQLVHLGISSPDKLRQHIESLFEKHSHQADVLIDIYRMVFPEWERIRKVKVYPESGDSLWKFICGKFQTFDRMHHPDCMPGGAWMNKGFSVNHKLPPWEISLDNCSVEYL